MAYATAPSAPLGPMGLMSYALLRSNNRIVDMILATTQPLLLRLGSHLAAQDGGFAAQDSEVANLLKKLAAKERAMVQ